MIAYVHLDALDTWIGVIRLSWHGEIERIGRSQPQSAAIAIISTVPVMQKRGVEASWPI